MTDLEWTSGVTRFEVIDGTGRILSRWGVAVELSVQDDGRTLKVFLRDVPADIGYLSLLSEEGTDV